MVAIPGIQSSFNPRQSASPSPLPESVWPTDVALANIEPPSTTGAELVEGGQIVARVAGEVVLASDVLWQVNQLVLANRQSASNPQGIPPEKEDEVRQMLLRRQVLGLIDTKLLFADFRRTVPPENLPKVEASLEEPFEKTEVPTLIKVLKVKDRAELSETLKANGSSLNDVKRQFVEKTIAGEWMRQRLPKTRPVTHEEMLEFYESRAPDYAVAPRIRYEELMVRFDRTSDRKTAWRDIAEMGNIVWQQAQAMQNASGPMFAQVARERSHGFTAPDGGVHEIAPDALQCDALNEALESLEVGQLSDVVESELGFHIVRVLERRPAGRRPFTDVQGEIREQLEAEQRKKLVEAEVAKLRSGVRVWTLFDGDIDGDKLNQLLDGPRR